MGHAHRVLTTVAPLPPLAEGWAPTQAVPTSLPRAADGEEAQMQISSFLPGAGLSWGDLGTRAQ